MLEYLIQVGEWDRHTYNRMLATTEEILDELRLPL